MRATRAKGSRKARNLLIVLLLCGVFCAAGLDGRLCVTEYEVASSELPAEFDGLRLAVVADPHGSFMQAGSELAARIAEEKVDVILLLGDMLDERAPDFEAFSGFLTEIAEIAPAYAGRQGGYTRILKLGQRRGDAAETCLLMLVEADAAAAEKTAEAQA